MIGASSNDIKLNTSFNLQTDLLVKKVNNVLAPVQKITELN
jgi:hypothetical protein